MNSRNLTTMTPITHYRSRNFWKWHNELVRKGFFRIYCRSKTKNVYSLKPPLEIIITSQVVSRLRLRYKPDREIGGILLAEPVRITFCKHVTD